MAQGWCRKSEETGRFYPTHQFTRLAFRVLDDIQRAEQRLQDQRMALTGMGAVEQRLQEQRRAISGQ